MKGIYEVFLNTTDKVYKNNPKTRKCKIELLETLDERLQNYSNKTGICKNRIINNLLTQRLDKIDKTSGKFYQFHEKTAVVRSVS